jgi:hypothetical protein
MRIRVQKGPDRGRFQVQVRSEETGNFVNLGTVKDTYSATTGLGTLLIGDVTYNQEETKEVRILAVGKNSGSTGRVLVLDYIGLTPKTP